MLDFGCGNGEYLEFLTAEGIEAKGIEQDTALTLATAPVGAFDAFNMAEVIEHLPDPIAVLERLLRLLKRGGIIYVETSLGAHLGDPAPSPYINPRIGHCLIHSRRSIEFLRRRLGTSLTRINDNVFILGRTESKIKRARSFLQKRTKKRLTT